MSEALGTSPPRGSGAGNSSKTIIIGKKTRSSFWGVVTRSKTNYTHGCDSNDATCAVVRVLCIPSHAKHCCRRSIWSTAVNMILVILLSSET